MTLSFLPLLQQAEKVETTLDGFLFPVQGSEAAAQHDHVFMILMYVAGFFFLLINAAAIYFSVKFRKSKSPEPQPSSNHNNSLEIVWTIIPTILVAWLFYIGMDGYVQRRYAPEDSYEIKVTGQKWSWNFTYPNGVQHNELHAPMGENVRLIMDSRDVIHSVWIPEFRIKMDVVPGRYTETWFNATRTGEYPLKCAEYCGTEHSSMFAKVVIHDRPGFDKWMMENSDFLANLSPVEAGEKLFSMKGCVACHTTNGTPLVGPTVKGMFGAERKFTDGTTAIADENYIRESLLEPLAKVVEGFAPSMPTFQGQLKAEEMDAIIEYIKTVQ
ncbi:MAG: cytochrome c oxidase subunit II [Planctomycetota bacterium]|jgi:cytochrome c oxidase subunit 2|nr:cytochrome c oxidase subunit II [Planctomycetota bacterium]